MTVFFLVPLYNESLNIPALSEGLKAVIPAENKFFVFVDDGSADNSVQLLKSKFAGHNFHIIEKEKNQGPGHSFNLGFEWILSRSPNSSILIVTLEADNTSDLSILPGMIAISRLGYDLVLASVYAQGGGFEKTSLMRRIISFFANMLFRAFFNVKVLTLSSFYRVYQVSLLQKIKKANTRIIEEKGFICMLEILLKAIRLNAAIIEVPMKLRFANRKGKSKMKILKTMISYLSFTLNNKFHR